MFMKSSQYYWDKLISSSATQYSDTSWLPIFLQAGSYIYNELCIIYCNKLFWHKV